MTQGLERRVQPVGASRRRVVPAPTEQERVEAAEGLGRQRLVEQGRHLDARTRDPERAREAVDLVALHRVVGIPHLQQQEAEPVPLVRGRL